MSAFTLQAIYQTSIDVDCNLPLFQSTSEKIHPSLKKAISLINNMIELNYITNEDNQLRFTSSGIEYMKKNYNKFINDVDLAYCGDYTLFKDLTNQIQMLAGTSPNWGNPIGMSETEKFQRQNYLIHLEEDDNIDYNRTIFLNKAEGEIMD